MKAREFNERFKVGDAVRYFPVRVNFDHIDTEIRSEAWELGYGQSAVKVRGRTGAVLVNHLAAFDGEMWVELK